MNIYIWSGLLSFFANLIVGLFVYARNPSSKNNRLFAVFSLCVAGWSVGSFLANIISDARLGLSIIRTNYVFAVVLPAVYLHLIFSVTDSLKEGIRRLIKFSYLISALFIPFVFTDLFIKGLKLVPSTNFRISDPAPVYFVFFAYFAVSMGMILIHLLRQIREGKMKEEPQFKYLVIANGLAIFAGFEYFSRVFGLFSSPPFDDYILVVYVFILSFAIRRYRIFDIETVAQAFQREKLATIGLIASSINHEIRNPLYAVKGLLETYVEFEETGIQKKTPLEVSKRALAQVNRALDVITKLNRFVKPASTEQEKSETGEPAKANVQEALQNVLDLIAYEFELDKIHIRNQISPNLPQIQADQRQLEEILFNLIVNACQAMKGGGTLTIQAEKGTGDKVSFPNVLIGNPKHRSPIKDFGDDKKGRLWDDKVLITIQDTGTGISQDQAKHLFEPFHTTKGAQGTGLGLYITKQLIERNGGKISAKSQEGKGTTFYLEFKACVSFKYALDRGAF